MKKSMKIMMAIALTMVTLGANAQFGVKLGYSNLSQKIESSGVSINPGSLSGFTAGAFYDIQFPVRGLSIRPGLNYTFGTGSFANNILRFSEDFDNISIKQMEHIAIVPVDIKYIYGFTDNFKVYGFAGPRFVVGMSSIFKMKLDRLSARLKNFNGTMTFNGVTTEGANDALFSRFDIRTGLGAGLQYRSLLVEVGHDWGMIDRLKDRTLKDVTWKMDQFFVGIGFMF